MCAYLFVLNTEVETVQSQETSTALTVIACITWFIRLVFYCIGVLNIVPKEPKATKEEPMASREEGKGDTANVSVKDCVLLAHDYSLLPL